MRTSRRLARVGLATTAATSLLLVGGTLPAEAAAPAMTLSSTSGPSGGGNSITGTVPATNANPNPFAAGSTPAVQFQYVGSGSSVCSPTAKAVSQIAAIGVNSTAGVLTVNPDNVKRTASTKIAFEVPAGPYPAVPADGSDPVNLNGLVLAGTQVTAKWLICVYDSPATTGSTLLGTAAYTLAVRPKIGAIIPASSPATGGQQITVTGTGFATASNATTGTIGGVPLTGIKVAANGSSFTAVTGARASATNLALTVTTPGGPVTSTDPDNNGLPQDSDDSTADAPLFFTYSNGVAITPATAPSGTVKADVDVKGVGFSLLNFNRADGALPTDPSAHVFLVSGAYVPGSNRGVQECKKVLVVSNAELICTLDLAGDRLNPADSSSTAGPTPEGTYTLTVVTNGAPDADPAVVNATIVSSGSTFTVGPY